MQPVDLVAWEALEESVRQHGPGAAEPFLGRLEHEQRGPREVAGLGEVLGGSEQHGGVPVVAAAVEDPRVLGAVLRAGLLTLGASSDTTLADLPDLLTNPAFRRKYLPAVMTDRVLAGFWTWYEGLSEGERASVIAPVR